MDAQFSELWQRLEAERHDLSYLNMTKPEAPVRVVEVIKTKRSAEREARMFHAGRYAAGARDAIAQAAHAWLQKDLTKNA